MEINCHILVAIVTSLLVSNCQGKMMKLSSLKLFFFFFFSNFDFTYRTIEYYTNCRIVEQFTDWFSTRQVSSSEFIRVDNNRVLYTLYEVAHTNYSIHKGL